MAVENKKVFKNNLESLGVYWSDVPDDDNIKNIKARIIIGPNGCGKSRLLRALSDTLTKNGVKKTDIVYANFPEMAGLERKGIEDEKLALLKNIFIDRRNTPIYDTLKLISSNPIKGVSTLVTLAENDSHCEEAVKKADEFLKPIFGEKFTMVSVADYFGEDKPLSPGQRSIFYMSVMLGVLAAHHKDDEFYILLDEPDLHLHAKSVVDFIKLIQENLPKAKLWVATHSVHLMTHFDFDEIIYIVDGKVQRNNSKIYDEICKTMVDTDAMQQFASFVGLYGFYAFFRECFNKPDADSNAGTTKFSHIQKRIRDLEIRKILDYGAGKGRFFKLLMDIPNIEYSAFECFHKYYEELNALIPSGKIYTNASDIPKGEFDAVLLINTLHEIPLDMWRTTFETIRRVLKNDGYLFFCETSPLVMGEKLINAGFLVLSTMEQHVLFNVESVHLDDSHKLHFSEIPKEKIPVLDVEKLKTTLDLLKTNSFKRWESEDKNARSAAFYAVQHLNAKKAMNRLPEIIEIAEELANKQKNIDLKSDNARYQYNLGVTLHVMERYDEALIAKQKAVDLEPANAQYQDSLGVTLYAMERYDEALIAQQKAVDLEPANALYQNNLGVTLHVMERYDEALIAQQKAVDLEPEVALCQYNLSATLHVMKRYDEALIAKQKAVELEPANAQYQDSLGVTLHEMKRYDEALIAKQKAVELEPENAQYQDSLGVTLHVMERYDEALIASQKAVDLEPENAQYQDSLGGTLHKMERYDEALIAKQKAVELEPANALYPNNLGNTLHAMERYDEALIAKQNAVNLEPENARYQNNLGVTLHEMERYDEALIAKQNAVNLEPENARYQNSLGATLYAMERYVEALIATQKAVELEPENAQYQSSLDITIQAMTK